MAPNAVTVPIPLLEHILEYEVNTFCALTVFKSLMFENGERFQEIPIGSAQSCSNSFLVYAALIFFGIVPLVLFLETLIGHMSFFSTEITVLISQTSP